MTTYTVSGNLGNAIGDSLTNGTSSAPKAWLVPFYDATVEGSEVRIGPVELTLDSSHAFSQANVPAGGWRVEVKYWHPTARQMVTWSTHFFAVAANVDIKDVVTAEAYLPAIPGLTIGTVTTGAIPSVTLIGGALNFVLPAGGGGGGGPIDADDITDATTVGKALIRAANAAAARAAFTTGTPTGTKFIRDDGVLATPSATLVLTERGVWASATAYATGDVVSWHGKRWLCNTAHTAGSDFDTTKFSDLGIIDLGVIVGANCTTYGHSWVSGWASRLWNSFRASQTLDASAGGSVTEDAAVAVEKNPSPYAGVHVIQSFINDASQGLTTARQASVVNGLRAWLDFVRASGSAGTSYGPGRLNTNSGIQAKWFTFTGTWTTTADTNRSSAQRKFTTTQNDTANLRWSGDAVTIMLLGQPDATGATYTITNPDATTVASGTLSNQTSAANQPVPVRLTGYGPGWHDVTLTKTDAAATILALDCLVVPSPAPPVTVVVKEPPVPDARNANIPAYNAVVDSVCAESFTSGVGAPLVVNPGEGTSWDLAVDTDGGFHPSTRGYDKIWRRVVTALSTVAYRPGIGTNYPPITGVASPLALADNFTRANSTWQPGSTSTGGRGWASAASQARFGIQSNQLYQTATSGGSYNAVLADAGKSDTTVSWTIGAKGSSNLILCFRGDQSEGTFYALLPGGGLNRLSSFAGTGLTPTTGTPPTYTTGDVIEVVLVGSSITVKKNGAAVATYTDSVLLGTRYGIGNFAPGGTAGGISAFSVS